MKDNKSVSLFQRDQVKESIKQSFVKLNPRLMIKNPVMFTVEVCTVFMMLVTGYSLFSPAQDSFTYNLLVFIILLVTLLFANFAEAIAEARGKAQADSLRKTREETPAKQLIDGKVKHISSSMLRKGDLFTCEAGDVIPADGEIIEGLASIDESAITGESAPVIREAGGDKSSVTGGTKVLSDHIVARVTTSPGESFLDKMIALVEGASRQKTPNEIALTILLSAFTLVFIIVCITLKPMADYSGATVPNEAATDKTTLSFDIYTDKQTSNEIISAGAEHSIVGNNADAFVRNAAGTPSVFTVSKDGKKVNFTDGNLQYMMPKQVYSLTVRKHIDSNTLYRKGKDEPQALEAKYNVLKGYYRLAPKQWIMVPPTNTTTKNGYFGEYTCVQDNNSAWNVSCTDNPVFDMFFFGKPEQPTLVDKSNGKYFLPTNNTEYQGTDKDWTNYANLGDSNDPLVTLSLKEWQYLFDVRSFPDDKSTSPFALAFLDLNGNGKVDPDADQAGVVIFPDGMTKSTAKSLFTAPNSWTFGKNRTLLTDQPSGNQGKILKMEAVTKMGCLFLPFPGWNSGYNSGKCKIDQIGRHFNYWTSTAMSIGRTMTHYNINMDGVFASTGGINGNAVRLVRFVK